MDWALYDSIHDPAERKTAEELERESDAKEEAAIHRWEDEQIEKLTYKYEDKMETTEKNVRVTNVTIVNKGKPVISLDVDETMAIDAIEEYKRSVLQQYMDVAASNMEVDLQYAELWKEDRQ